MSAPKPSFLNKILLSAVTAAGMLFGRIGELKTEELITKETDASSPTLLIAGGVLMKPGLGNEKWRCGAPWASFPKEEIDLWGFFQKGVELSGEKNPNLLVITTAAGDEAQHYGESYRELLQALFPGCHVDYIDWVTPKNDAQQREKILKAKVIFMTGGDQLHFEEGLGADTETRAALKNFKGIIPTNSASSMFLSDRVIRRPDVYETIHDIEYRTGSAIAGKNVIIDTHILRGADEQDPWPRLPRMKKAVDANPDCIVVGVDERTALLKQNGKHSVWGQQNVYVMLANGRSHNFPPENKFDVLGIPNLFKFKHGDVLDLDTLSLVPPQQFVKKQSPTPAPQR